jgi:ABC-type branched-subunit amino acid transport system ATPase component
VTPSDLGGEPLLHVRSIVVRFGGLTANNDVSLEVKEGQVAALIGPNGAGKTTLFNVITGAQAPTSGRVLFGGEDITDLDRRRRAQLGMGRTFQNLSLVPSLSVLDNATVGMGRFRRRGLVSAILGLSGREDRFIRETARHALDFVGLGRAADRPTGDLPYGDRRRLELARALALAPRLLLLDEPSAGMGPAETEDLANTIQRARAELGVTVLVVEHDMSFVRSLADHTTVLEFGEVIASGVTASVLEDPRVAEAYLGRSGATTGA